MDNVILLKYSAVLLLITAGSCSEQPNAIREPLLACPAETVFYNGEATYYRGADGRGSCSYDSSGNAMIAAVNQFDFNHSQLCGAAVSVSGPESTIVVRIVDSCPECPRGNIDLSPHAFSLIADTLLGRVPIRWHVIPAPVEGPVSYRFKDSLNYWWSAVQIRNHRYPVYSVEYQTPDGSFSYLPRMPYNFFAGYMNMGERPFTFRVTDVYGHMVVDSGIVPRFNGDVAGSSQFPLCPIDE